jgi:hypothetical protein
VRSATFRTHRWHACAGIQRASRTTVCQETEARDLHIALDDELRHIVRVVDVSSAKLGSDVQEQVYEGGSEGSAGEKLVSA